MGFDPPAQPEGDQREGQHRLRLVVAPPELDLGTLTPAELSGALGQLTLVDLPFQVTRR